MELNEITKIYPELNSMSFDIMRPSIKDSIVNRYHTVLNEFEGVNGYLYKFKNQLLHIFELKDESLRLNFLLQLHMIVIANSKTKESNMIKLTLFRFPRSKDANYDPKLENKFNISFGGKVDPNMLEKLIAFYNGIPIEISRDFLSIVMDLQKGETISKYLDRIDCEYTIEAFYNMSNIYFTYLVKSMVNYQLTEDQASIINAVKILESGKSLILYVDQQCEVRLSKEDSFLLNLTINEEVTPDEETKLGGLLKDVDWLRLKETNVVIDTLTANTLLVYFYNENNDNTEEGLHFLFNILKSYPTIKEVNI